MGNNQYPYRTFGQVLKKLRAKASKTVAEVSGAVEIDETKLAQFEDGKLRPTEDILLLLIQHFDLKDVQATELWSLAGYDGLPDQEKFFINDEYGDVQQTTVMISAQDARIVYTDMIQVMVNNYGVIINFMQGAGPGNQPMAVSRVGMSKEHARSVLEVLKKTLEQSEIKKSPKLLSPPSEQ